MNTHTDRNMDEQDQVALNYAQRLAAILHSKVAPGTEWWPLHNIEGVLSQIDNMLTSPSISWGATTAVAAAVPPVDSDWVTFDIEKEAYSIVLARQPLPSTEGGARVVRFWQDFSLPPDRDYRTLLDGRVLVSFAGWQYYEPGIWYMQPISNSTGVSIPLKIRFWAKRITKDNHD